MLFRASNDLGLDADGDLSEVSFNVSLTELRLAHGWTWCDLHHFSAQRVLLFPDGALLLQADPMYELWMASFQIRGLISFS
jgi:hypothetical protein